MNSKPMKRMNIYNPFTDENSTDENKEKVVVKEKIIIVRGGVTPEIALKALEQANDEFACEGEIPWKLAERIFFKKRLIHSKAEFNSIIEYLEALGKVKIAESFDSYMRLIKVIQLKKGDTQW